MGHTRGGDDDKTERRVSIRAKRGPHGPVLVAITVVAAACGSEVVLPSSSGGGGGAGGTTTTVSSGGTGGTGGLNLGGFGTGAGPTSICDEIGGFETSFTVTVPVEGVPADAGQICAVSMGPVESNQAARVTLLKDPQDLHLASGEVVVDPALLPDVVGLPTIDVATSPDPQLSQMTVSNVQPTATGFSFDAAWPEPLVVGPFQEAMLILRTSFDLTCGPNQSQQVQALTHINLCIDEDDVAWISSGDECTICGIIAEMAPSPVVPDHDGDDIGLGEVIKLRVVTIARIGETMVFLAEHDAGENARYDWVVSAGELVEVAPDMVAWTPPAEGGPHLLQVAVHHDDGAAVASYSAVPVRDAGMVA
jgi:hypothetical protein